MDRGFGGLTTNGPCCTCTAYQGGCLGVSERQIDRRKGWLRATRRVRAKDIVKGKKLKKKNIAFVCLDKPTRDLIPRRQWIPARRLDGGFGEVYGGGVFAGEEDEGYLLFTYQTASTAEG